MDESKLKAFLINSNGDDTHPIIIPNVPEQIASFVVMTKNANSILIIGDGGDTILTTSLGFIFNCPNQTWLMEKLYPVLIPMQRGEMDPVKIDMDFSAWQEETGCIIDDAILEDIKLYIKENFMVDLVI
ncbi:MAG: hypothetical protein N3B21_17880 [Clostridia bacterium]|nr:hypothetical protein [Clostridia bacterium]